MFFWKIGNNRAIFGVQTGNKTRFRYKMNNFILHPAVTSNNASNTMCCCSCMDMCMFTRPRCVGKE